MNKVFEKGRIVNKPEYSQNYIQICPLEIHQRQAICNMTLEQNNYRTYHEFFNFTLRGENDVGTNVQSFWINNYESGKFYKGGMPQLTDWILFWLYHTILSVIPPRPEYTFEKITNDSVIIKWYNNKHSFYAAKGLEYEVLLRPKNRDIDWMNYKDYTVPNNNRSEYKMIVYNIPYAYFLYELSVRVRVIKSSAAHYDESYWSEPFIREFRTSACPPATAPLTDVGSFYIDPTETQLRLYWHEIPDYLENGPDFKYIIKQVKVDGVEVWVGIFP